MSTIAAFASHTGAQGGYGGGEAYTFALLHILDKYYDLEVFTTADFPAFYGADEYGLDISDLNWRAIPDNFNWQQYDMQLNISHSTILPPHARRNILFVLFPQHPDWDVSGYDSIVTISDFCAKWIKRYWGRDAEVVYPAVHTEDLKPLEKTKSIVSIGRFFDVPGGNNKNHLWLIRAFKRLTDYLPDPDEWELHLVGSIQHTKYLDKVKAEADWRVHFHHDIDRQELRELLGHASYYWHGAGYKSTAPSGKEHFGIVAVEAMAAGAIPIVHNSGGITEIGCLTWDEPDDLVQNTLELIENPEKAKILRTMMQERALDFSLEAMTRPLLEVTEAPVLIPPNVGKAKIFPRKKPIEEIKVGVLSDSPRITTGFGVVTRMVVDGLCQEGFQVACLGMYDYDPNPRRYRNDPVTIWRGCSWCNQSGLNLLGEFLRVEKPDVLYMNYDPGNCYEFLRTLEELQWESPLIVYFPVESLPLMNAYGEMAKATWLKGGVPITYTQWGAKAIMSQFKCKVEVAPHGIEHADFKPLDNETRAKMRYAVGWGDKFVAGFVARNKRVKSLPTLLDALEILVREGHEDIVLYLHTNPDEQNQLGAYPLRQMVDYRGLGSKVFFPPDLAQQVRGIPYDKPIEIDVPETQSIEEARAYNMVSLNMVQRYNLMDVFCDVSQAEGFGLPAMESSACGVPLICPKDNGVREEIWGDAPIYLPVAHWDTWHTAGLLCQVAPATVAQAILKLKQDVELRQDVARRCYDRVQMWSWTVLQKRIVDLCQRLVNR